MAVKRRLDFAAHGKMLEEGFGVVDHDGHALLPTLMRPVRPTAWPDADALPGLTSEG
jgi:hypothetical protein